VSNVIAETQFSIYKIDAEKIMEVFFPDKRNVTKSEMLEALLNKIDKNLRKKNNCDNFSRIKFKGYEGIIFKTLHEPDWKCVLQQMLFKNESSKAESLPDDFLLNASISYVMFRICQGCLYAMTGGYGSSHIREFVEKNYGLYLLPKMLKKENPVVKNVVENNLTGNHISTHRTNRTNTSFLTEQDLSSIYKQLNVEIDRDIALTLGIEFDEKESVKKKINLVNKDSLVIRRSVSLSNLTNILAKLNELEKRDDNFALNYLVMAKKKGIKKTDLVNHLIDNFKNGIYDTFVLVGDDYENYVLNADRYRIICDDGSIFMESNIPITLDDIFNEITRQGLRISATFWECVLKKWQFEMRDRNGNKELYPQSIINILQGFIEYGVSKQPCYLINGDWYVFDEVYSNLLNQEYDELYNLKLEKASSVKKNYNLVKAAINETAYNKALETEKTIIVSHGVQFQYVEIADAIFWDDTTLYLMHNKGKFKGECARDLFNQMLTAAALLQKNHLVGGSDFFASYYSKICEKKKLNELPQASEQEFIQIFTEKRICFIAGFLNGFKKKTKSTYAKYLTIEADKKLSNKGYDYIPLGIK
jgi:hypothetical protein